MKRRILSLMLAMTMILALPGCSSGASPAPQSGGTETTDESNESGSDSGESAAADNSVTEDTQGEGKDAAGSEAKGDAEEGKDEEILKTISEMTLEQKLSQMMIVGLRSDPNNTKCATEITEDYAELLK